MLILEIKYGIYKTVVSFIFVQFLNDLMLFSIICPILPSPSLSSVSSINKEFAGE